MLIAGLPGYLEFDIDLISTDLRAEHPIKSGFVLVQVGPEL